MELPVIEVFEGIQGEGLKTGLKTIFVRLAGCNFALDKHPCPYCDTDYAWNYQDNPDVEGMTVNQILGTLHSKSVKSNIKEVCLTGGEPLFHDIEELINRVSYGYELAVETNGSVPIWEMRGMWSMDIKCPSSGNVEYNCYDNLKVLTKKDQLKFVIGSKRDFEFASEVVKSRALLCSIIFQPAWKVVPLSALFQWVLEDKDLQVRIGTQLHKIAYPRRRRGV